MTLSIDTSTLKTLRIRIDDGRKTVRSSYTQFADKALPIIAKKIGKKKPSALGVVNRAGAFSATRTGVALMNALAYGWGVPVVALTKEEFDADATIPRGERNAVPVIYDKAPNITVKKQ